MHIRLSSVLSEEEVNLQDLSERIIAGPQERILNSLEVINSYYGTNFRSTKTFRWRPGFYKELNVAMSKLRHLDKPAKSVSSAFNKAVNHEWRYNRFQEAVRRVDSEMYELRRQNIRFQDNSDTLYEAFYTFINTIGEESQKLEDTGVSIQAYASTYSRDRLSISTVDALTYVIKIKDMVMDIGTRSVSSPVEMGDMQIYITLKMIDIFGALISGNDIIINHDYNHQGLALGARYYPKWSGQKFPYSYDSYDYRTLYYGSVSESYNNTPMDRYTDGGNRNQYGSVCLGDLKKDIILALSKGNLSIAAFYLRQWASFYHINLTSPLNNYSYAFFGKPKALYTGDMDGTLTYRESSSCSYTAFPEDVKDSYCDVNECLFKETCSQYEEAYLVEDEEILFQRDQITAEYYLARNLESRLETEGIIENRTNALLYRVNNANTANRYWSRFYSAILDHFSISVEKYTFLRMIDDVCQAVSCDSVISYIYNYNSDLEGYYNWLDDNFPTRMVEPILIDSIEFSENSPNPVDIPDIDEARRILDGEIEYPANERQTAADIRRQYVGLTERSLEEQLLESYSRTGNAIPINGRG